MDIRVKAIREDKMVGRGTCTYIDEAFEDSELLEWLDEAEVPGMQEAVEWARDYERLKIEMAAEREAPWALARLDEWAADLDKYPVTC